MRKIGNQHSRPPDLDLDFVAYLILERRILIDEVRNKICALDGLLDGMSQGNSGIIEPHSHEDLSGFSVWRIELSDPLVACKRYPYSTTTFMKELAFNQRINQKLSIILICGLSMDQNLRILQQGRSPYELSRVVFSYHNTKQSIGAVIRIHRLQLTVLNLLDQLIGNLSIESQPILVRNPCRNNSLLSISQPVVTIVEHRLIKVQNKILASCSLRIDYHGVSMSLPLTRSVPDGTTCIAHTDYFR